MPTLGLVASWRPVRRGRSGAVPARWSRRPRVGGIVVVTSADVAATPSWTDGSWTTGEIDGRRRTTVSRWMVAGRRNGWRTSEGRGTHWLAWMVEMGNYGRRRWESRGRGWQRESAMVRRQWRNAAMGKRKCLTSRVFLSTRWPL